MSRSGFAQRYGPWALVTGAARGIGAEFALQAAERGLNVALLDRDADAARAHAEAVGTSTGVETRVIAADLGQLEFLAAVRSFSESHTVGLLVCNAALGTVGPFTAIPLADMLASLDVNCRATLALAREFLPGMAARRRGGVILVSSNSAYQGTPYVAHYAATKAYNLVLGEGLWYEMRDHGVDVLAFAPGATNTPGLRRGAASLREGETPSGVMLAGPTAAAALAALGHTPSALPGWRNRLQTFVVTRLLSRRRAVETIGKRSRKLTFSRSSD